MDTRLILHTFFQVNLDQNGFLEALGNKLMRPLKKHFGLTWYDIRGKQIVITGPNNDLLDKIALIIEASLFSISYLFTLWKILDSTKGKLAFRHIALLICGTIAAYPLILVLGTLIKIASWTIPSVRKKNLEYIQIKKEEQKALSYLLPQNAPEKQLTLNNRRIHPQDKLSPLPLVLKQLILEYLPNNSAAGLKRASKMQYEDVSKSAECINRNLIKKVFPPLFLLTLGMEKIVHLMSQPSLKHKLAAEDLIPIHENESWSRPLLENGAPPIESKNVWHFDPTDMHKQTMRWGKSSEGNVYIAISYKYHSSPVLFTFWDRKVSGKEGISIFTFNKEKDQWKIAVTPTLEKKGPRYYEGSFIRTYDKVNCFVVNDKILTIEDYLPRLLKGEPCGAILNDGHGNFAEGPKKSGNHSMVEVVPFEMNP